MFLSKVMDHLESEVDDIFGGVSLKDKISKYYEYSSLTKGHSEIDNTDDIWPLTVFLTPPSSPDSSPSYEAILNEKQDETDAEMLTGASRTKDLKSMLIRDCMWNGESPKKGRNFEKLRPLTKTPPLIDCNLRIMYVDPSEIWPFNFNEQLKAGKATAVDNNNDNTDEEVEVDVVGLEGSQKVESKNKDQTESKNDTQKCEVAPASCNVVETTPQHCKNTDHDYSCNLRSGTKRRRSSNSDSDKENCTEEKTRILSGDESDPDCEVIGRATHNVLERKRRNELKLRFQYLRDSIPDLRGNDRAPKVSILQKAYNYILQVQAEERCLLEEIRIQKNRKEQLLKKVLEMQKNNFSCQDI